MDRESHPSDLTDERWALIEPMITAWKQNRVKQSVPRYSARHGGGR